MLAVAGDLADEVGLDRLTLAMVAERCGVALPSLYKHVAGLDAVRRGLAVAGAVELGNRLGAAAVGRSGRAALHAVADAYRAFAHERPGRYAASVRAPADGDQEHAAAARGPYEVVRAVVDGYPVRSRSTVDAVRGLRSAVHGFVALEAAGGFGLPEDLDRSFAELVAVFDRAWSAAPGDGSGQDVSVEDGEGWDDRGGVRAVDGAAGLRGAPVR
ncbi:TetR-like C-terminal domain-containing protein [Nakamurella endophytica]|uniref:TetR-like C-terminal domain-containing protein n=1 Tax=Nakamurella endophytica TaxID=1748367 RepID=UPI001E2DA28F|nr:TetR-like C-terminal domain-containing protein [Nakamurella endophytica]